MEPETLTAATAAAAIAAAIENDQNAQDGQPGPQQVAPSGVEPEAPTPSEAESPFTGIDPTSLAPELQALYRSMQGDYTREKQALKARERELDAFGGVDVVRGAVDFVQALQDPQNLIQLHADLSEYLQAEGLTKAQADAVASEAVTADPDPYEDDGFTDSRVNAELQRAQQELSDLKEWRESVEQERLQEQMELHLSRQEAVIKHQHPEYSDEDMESIYRYSWAFGGDLTAAQEAFEGERQRILSAYAASKANVPSAVSPPNSQGYSQQPDSFGDDVEAAHRYAKQRLQAIRDMGGID